MPPDYGYRITLVAWFGYDACLDDGAIVESGSHEKLLARQGIYAELYSRQRLTEELEAM